MMGIFIKRGNSDRDKTGTEERQREHTWQTPSANQGIPEATKSQERGLEHTLPPHPWKEPNPAETVT